MPENAPEPKLGTLPKKVTVANLLQPENTLSPTLVTDAGIVIDTKPVQ